MRGEKEELPSVIGRSEEGSMDAYVKMDKIKKTKINMI